MKDRTEGAWDRRQRLADTAYVVTCPVHGRLGRTHGAVEAGAYVTMHQYGSDCRAGVADPETCDMCGTAVGVVDGRCRRCRRERDWTE